jgi:hypothetical protein
MRRTNREPHELAELYERLRLLRIEAARVRNESRGLREAAAEAREAARLGRAVRG